MSIDDIYCKLLQDLLDRGSELVTRNDKVKRLIAQQVTFRSTPLISVRRTAWKNALREFEWFLSGSNNICDLHPAVHSWWQPWADANGTIANNYAVQFCDFAGHDNRTLNQINYLINGVKNHPYSRRNAITTWNTADMTAAITEITNCHSSYLQCFVDSNHNLTVVMYQRSVDVICGLPHNWLQYWAFLLWLASRTNTNAYAFTWIGGDVHLYAAHDDLAQQLINNNKPIVTPELVYRPSSQEFLAEDFTLSEPYQPILTTRARMIV